MIWYGIYADPEFKGSHFCDVNAIFHIYIWKHDQPYLSRNMLYFIYWLTPLWMVFIHVVPWCNMGYMQIRNLKNHNCVHDVNTIGHIYICKHDKMYLCLTTCYTLFIVIQHGEWFPYMLYHDMIWKICRSRSLRDHVYMACKHNWSLLHM